MIQRFLQTPLLVVVFSVSACANTGRSLQNEELEPRTHAAGRIIEAAILADYIRVTRSGSTPSAGMILTSAFAARFAGMPNSAEVGANEESYRKADVDACVSSIWIVGLSVSSTLAALTCELEPRPAILFGIFVL